jgi:NitT/TauT family transport system ATP-binding protein
MEIMSIRLINIDKSFGDRKILDGFSIEMKPGSVTCLFGPSGCGKTTILNLIGGMVKPDSGRIEGIDGSRLSCIFQETRILPWKNVLENVLFPLHDIMDRPAAMETAMKFIGMVGLKNECGLYPAQLSGGMKQRVSIARAFAYPGSLILMDEAFQNLDQKLKYSILDSFLKIWESDRRTVIFVTHDIDEAIRMGRHIIFLNRSPLEIIRILDTTSMAPNEVRDFAEELYHQ